MTVTHGALIVRIPWDEIVPRLRSKFKFKGKIKLTAGEVLDFVKEGRLAHRQGKTKLINSLSDLR